MKIMRVWGILSCLLMAVAGCGSDLDAHDNPSEVTIEETVQSVQDSENVSKEPIETEAYCFTQCRNGPAPGEFYYLTCFGTCSVAWHGQGILCNGEWLNCNECTPDTCLY